MSYAALLCPVPHFSVGQQRYLFIRNEAALQPVQIDGEKVAACLKYGLAPFAVSIVPRKCFKPLNLVWLVDLSSRSQRRFKDESCTQFAVCVPPVISNSRDLRQDLIEFIEVNRVFGARRFFFYVETEQAEFLSCLQKYRSISGGTGNAAGSRSVFCCLNALQ
jgi:hypothetical protein